MSPNKITELTDKVIEECSEVIQAVCKVKRFGWFNYHPDRPESNNLDELRQEMDDAIEAFAKLEAVLIQVQHSHHKA